MNANIAALLYLVAGVLFIQALRGLSSPDTSRRGNLLGMIGMTIAVLTTLGAHPPSGLISWALVVGGIAVGGGIGAVIARRVPMTAMPELVAAFHSLVGMAAVLVAAGAYYAPAAFDIGTQGRIPRRTPVRVSASAANAEGPPPRRKPDGDGVWPDLRFCSLHRLCYRSELADGENKRGPVLAAGAPC